MSKNRCKVCKNADIRAQVDQMITDGVSDVKISQALASLGVDISCTSILRHRHAHYERSDSRIEYDDRIVLKNDDIKENRIDVELIDNLLNETDDYDCIQSALKNRLSNELLLSRIVREQLALVYSAMIRFKNDGGRYPADLINSLQRLYTLYERSLLYTRSESMSDESLQHSYLESVREKAYKQGVDDKKHDRKISVEDMLIDNGFFVMNRYIEVDDYNNMIIESYTKGFSSL
jgi:hypothetical protein